MRETIILANGLNGTEFKRTLASRVVNTFCYRVFSSVNLSLESLNRSCVHVDKKQISHTEEIAIIYSIIQKDKYFSNISFKDAKSCVKAVRTLRKLVNDTDELAFIKSKLLPGKFEEKNLALLRVVEAYLSFLNNKDLIDGSGLINLAIRKGSKIDADFYTLEEFDLTPAELLLLDVVSDGDYKTVGINSFYNVETNENCFKEQKPDCVKAYGSINELESIIDEIYTTKSLDKCVIATSNDSSYNQQLFDLSMSHNIPITFSQGVAITNSNPAKLLDLFAVWDTNSYHGSDALRDIIKCEAFNLEKLKSDLCLNDTDNPNALEDLIIACGNYKISTDKTHNEKVIREKSSNEQLIKFARILEQGIPDFLVLYTIIRPGKLETLDRVSLQFICEFVSCFTTYCPEISFYEIYDAIMSVNVCKEVSRPGHLHVTNINGLFSTMRDNIYISGLQAKDFPGSPKEDYLLLDCDLQNFEGSTSSAEKIKDKISAFKSLTQLICALNINLKFSYSYYDLSELKEQNASSVLYDIYDDFDTQINEVGFSNARMSETKELVAAYQKDTDFEYGDNPFDFCVPEKMLQKTWSPSAIEQYFDCPRKFYFNRILHIPEDVVQDPFEVLNPMEIGTLAHGLMEFLGTNKSISWDDFKAKCIERFNDMLQFKEVMVKNDYDNALSSFLIMMKKAYNLDVSNPSPIIASEQTVSAKHESSGLNLGGRIDRVENTPDGDVIVDFKTGNSISQNEKKPETCLQILIYAWIWSQQNNDKNVLEGQYRYFKKEETVHCSVNENSMDVLEQYLQQFAQALKEGIFPRCGKNCKYCTYEDICLFPNELSEVDDNDD